VSTRGDIARELLDHMERWSDRPAQREAGEDGTWTSRDYATLRQRTLTVAGALRRLGVQPGDRVALIADSGPWWIPANLGILAAGAADVPRGSDSTPTEIGIILEHSGAEVCLCIGDAAVSRLRAIPGALERLRAVVHLDGEGGDGILSGTEFLSEGPADTSDLPERLPQDLASVIYTSGTTGRPKGVTLEHRNFLHQVQVLPGGLDAQSDDLFLVMLPPWHCFERMVEYVAVVAGAEVAFSDPRRLRQDLPAVQPTWMASVPRIWEMILHLSGYRRLAKRDAKKASLRLHGVFGGRLRCAVSGGGRLPDAVDQAYGEAGVRLLVGYGLTETSPVLTVRRPEDNRLGTIGRTLPDTEIAIVDRVTGAPLPHGTPGVIHARGPQIMRGYWEDPDRSREVLLPDGWFDTGDLGALSAEGDLSFRGRAKETIALLGGENVEPAPLEERLCESPLIAQVVVLGSDRKVLGAVVVPSPDGLEEALAEAPEGADVESLLRGECARLLTEQAGFMAHERIARIAVLVEPFTVENGLMTATMKIRRTAVVERHADAVAALFGS